MVMRAAATVRTNSSGSSASSPASGVPATRTSMLIGTDSGCADRLANAGHEVEVLDEPYSAVMGHAGAVVLHKDGTCEGAHDPRADGGAAGG